MHGLKESNIIYTKYIDILKESNIIYTKYIKKKFSWWIYEI
jgi:hypothetical protein